MARPGSPPAGGVNGRASLDTEEARRTYARVRVDCGVCRIVAFTGDHLLKLRVRDPASAMRVRSWSMGLGSAGAGADLPKTCAMQANPDPARPAGRGDSSHPSRDGAS